MRYLTILNQGTMNDSGDLSTSDGNELVVSRLRRMLAGKENDDWIHTEGAGTDGLEEQGVKTSMLGGIFRGKGVGGNTQRAVKFVQDQLKATKGGLTVNMVGHSRGSITCYKIARALRDDPLAAEIPVNIFAIDPVPGNMGVMNHKNWRGIALGGNLKKSFLLLAESDRRLPFRAYIDALYSMGMPDHRVDTIPGTHGGINELGGDEREAAAIVFSRALEFLRDRQTPLSPNAPAFILDATQRLDKYARLMQRIKEYKKHGLALDKYATGLLRMEKRHVMVYGSKKDWGKGGGDEVSTQQAAYRDRGGHHGMKLSKAMETVLGETAHSKRPNRFFANLEHQTLFGERYGNLYTAIKALERGGAIGPKAQLVIDATRAAYTAMGAAEKEYFAGWLAQLGLKAPE